MRGQRHAPAAPYPRERPGTYCTGGWVGLRAGLDWCGESRPTGIRSPDRPARRQSLYRLRYPAHQRTNLFLDIFVQCGWRGTTDVIRYLSLHLPLIVACIRSLSVYVSTQFWNESYFIRNIFQNNIFDVFGTMIILEAVLSVTACRDISTKDSWRNFTFMWPCIVTDFFIIKPTKCTSFPNLLRHETLHVSDSSTAHHQEFIHCTMSSGVCHRGLKTAFEQDQDGTGPSRKLSSNLCDIHHCWVYSE